MNALSRIITAEAVAVTRLGNPSQDYAAQQRRLTAMATMTGTHGFRVPQIEPKTDAQGLTRGDRKRAARAAASAKVSETRAPQFMHSAARRQLEAV
ncbi:MAG: hypothetical protein EOS04_24460 [Mesorhizobium sp.]|nr:MAG: hypothetical protein EOR98_26800 [Mesorhizobium sp.]RWN73150.1 MAG: hypothetical protein EOS01_26755 [Mesorhizobium sp.]RWN85196.1 MAG: hypothetical protein EOS04_24460 [Mesorhizobium sp.]